MKKVKINTDILINLSFIVISIILVGSIIKLLIDNKKSFNNREPYENEIDTSIMTNLQILNANIQAQKYTKLNNEQKLVINSYIIAMINIVNNQIPKSQDLMQNIQTLNTSLIANKNNLTILQKTQINDYIILINNTLN
jgi:hypothetical protein